MNAPPDEPDAAAEWWRQLHARPSLAMIFERLAHNGAVILDPQLQRRWITATVHNLTDPDGTLVSLDYELADDESVHRNVAEDPTALCVRLERWRLCIGHRDGIACQQLAPRTAHYCADCSPWCLHCDRRTWGFSACPSCSRNLLA